MVRLNKLRIQLKNRFMRRRRISRSKAFNGHSRSKLPALYYRHPGRKSFRTIGLLELGKLVSSHRTLYRFCDFLFRQAKYRAKGFPCQLGSSLRQG